MTLPLTTPNPLKLNNVTVYVDLKTRLAIYEYRNVVNIETTEAVYKWMSEGMSTWFDVADFRASIFDFRQVTHFEIGNTPVAIRASQAANEITDLARFPVALIVSTLRQEVKVRTTMMGGDGARKYVSRSEDQALAFINEWNGQHGRTFDIDDRLLTFWPPNPH